MSANDKTKNQPWSGRFSEPATELVQRFTASVSFDRRLAEFDIEGSIAHARMLHAVGIIGKSDLAAIEKGLAQIRSEIRDGRFPWSEQHEDVHFNIERRLTDLVGEPGKRLHTARSRNDQVATDVRLYLRAAIDQVLATHQVRAARAARPRRRARRDRDAGLHAPAGSAAGDLRPSPAGLLRDARARRAAACRLPQAGEPAAARRGGACRHLVPDRPADGREGTGLRRRVRELDRRRVRSRLRDRVLRLRRAGDDAPLALLRGAHPVDEPALRFRRRSPTASAPAPRSCRRRKTPTWRS